MKEYIKTLEGDVIQYGVIHLENSTKTTLRRDILNGLLESEQNVNTFPKIS